jgi:hypothetical protein
MEARCHAAALEGRCRKNCFGVEWSFRVSGFSPEWLSLRERADHRARDGELLAKLGEHFKGRDSISVFDLGTGTGSNLRAIAPILSAVQRWTLVDHDPELLAAACDAVARWADRSRPTTNGIDVSKNERSILVRLLRADLAANNAPWGDEAPDLVTAAALFDLASKAWIERLVEEVAKKKAAFYTALTHSSVARWSPPHPLDAAMTEAFETHFSIDKGFGPAAGSHATAYLVSAFGAAGYQVERRESPWRLGGGDEALIAELAKGWAAAAKDTKRLSADEIKAWLAARMAGGTCIVGHEDLLALPR